MPDCHNRRINACRMLRWLKWGKRYSFGGDINRVQIDDPFFEFALGKFSVGCFEGVPFPLAAMFFYPIIVPADFMPIKTRIIWALDQELSGTRTLAHAQIMGGDKQGC